MKDIFSTKNVNQYDVSNQKNIGNLIMKSMMALLMVLMLSMTSFIQANAAGLADLFDSSQVDTGKKEFLKVDQAFSIASTQQGSTLTVSIDITPEHYVYKDKFKLRLPNGVTASAFTFSKPTHSIDDPYFGKVAVFDQNQVTATATLTNTTGNPIQQDITLTWQGCAKAGLCYPPQTQKVSINLPAATSTKVDKKTASNSKQQVNTEAKKPVKQITSEIESQTETRTANQTDKNQLSSNKNNNINIKSSRAPTEQGMLGSDNQVNELSEDTTAGVERVPSSVNNAFNDDINATDETLLNTEQSAVNLNLSLSSLDQSSTPQGNVGQSAISNASSQNDGGLNLGGVVDQDPFGLAKHPWLALGLLFIAGLGLAFTPCVLPMLPIVSNIIARQHTPTAKKGLVLSGSYALGVAIAYGILGALIAIFGQSLGIIGWLQNPVILVAFAVVFMLLALYMLDIFRLPVSNSLKQKMQSASRAGDRHLGSTFGSFIAGFLSALVVSPCVSAPLFGALLAVSTIGNPLLGFAALFMLGFGLSAPLMLLGVSQGNLMPKAGEWMNWIKQGFALLLFAVSLLLIERVLISPIMLMLWALWFMIVASWAWRWSGRGIILSKAIAMIFAFWSAISLVGAAMGSHDVWQPLSMFKTKPVLVETAPIENNVTENNYAETNQLENKNATVSLGSTMMPATQPINNTDMYMTSLDELIPVIQQKDKVLVDVTAEWCVECRIMDKTLFTNRPASLQNWQVVKLDVTDTTANSERILSELRLFGPPALLYFVNGRLQAQQVGTIGRTEFEQTLASL